MLNMKLTVLAVLTLVMVATESCTIILMPRGREQVNRLRNDSTVSTGGLRMIWRTDTVTTGSYRLFTEATFTSLNDQHMPLIQRGGIKPVSSGLLQFDIDDLNPGNYVIEMVAYRRGVSGGFGRSSSVQVTAGKHREYTFGDQVAFFPAPPGRVRAEEALKKVMGLDNCIAPTETVYVNKRYPDSIEKFDPTEDRIIGFESSFDDTVAIYVNGTLVERRTLKTSSNGSAGQVRIKAKTGAKISISTTPNDCMEFELKDGYKYLFINRYPARKWDIAYSNFSRGYY